MTTFEFSIFKTICFVSYIKLLYGFETWNLAMGCMDNIDFFVCVLFGA